MPAGPPETRLWRAPNAVMALAAAAALLVLAACGGLIYYASQAVNGITQARETRLMERTVETRLHRLKDDVASVTIWSDAYDYTARRFDPAWAQINYGTYFHQYLHHDLTVVLDAADRPIYAAVDGEATDPAEVAAFTRAIRALVAQTRAKAETKVAGKPQALAFERVGDAQAAVRAGDRVFMVAASTVAPEPEYTKPLLDQPEAVVVSAVEIDGRYLGALEDDYGVRRVVLNPTARGPAVSLPGADGAPVATLGWTPERPGVGVYSDARWWIASVGVIVVLVVGALILRLRTLARDVTVARDRAEAGDRAKSEFIANMSHEIRTPLNGVLGMAQAMEGYELSADQRERLKVIRESGATLLGVLNDVLDLSKIEAGKMELAETEFTLAELGERVCATFAEMAAAKDLDLVLRAEGPRTDLWTGDALRIRQVLSNLVSNALKFTTAGVVTLRIEPLETGVRFSVSDTGIGLSDAQIPRMFEKFSQADASTTRRYGGTGLGLAICRELIALMGGSIAVQSEVGKGSTFAVTLPLRRADAAPRAPEVEAPTVPDQTLRVLAAEDNLTNQLVLRALIEPLDAELTLASNGREAVEAFSAQAFDVVLMDIQMPEMNGIDATRMIRDMEAARRGPRTPILALTANVMSHQVESYLAAGMDGHIAKPLDAATLYAALDAALSQAAEARAAA